ncbi:MAG: NADH-quinone oxidoreductase subunit [Pseudonocardiales bacterium]|jgi:NADH-quinone oxidoreductase subunit C|nr:NADH-quinone oxidoreductase subunit [Pseudonocardiales bacterium]
MSGPGPTERPVPADAAPEQRAADIQPLTVDPGASPDAPAPIAPGGMFGVTGSGDTTGFGRLKRQPWEVPGAERPFGGYFDELVDALQAAYPDFDAAVSKIAVDRGELTLHVRREHLLGIAAALRNGAALRFELCSSVSGVDYLGLDPERLHSVYHLTSMTYRRRIRLEVAVPAEDPHVPSLTALYPTADWQERETYDLFGIVYDGHPALTRIMMPDDWDGHPQRKDYPLGGIPVQYKGATIPPPDERRRYS